MQAEGRLPHIREILGWVQSEEWGGSFPDRVNVVLPEYLPPVLVEDRAEEYVRHVGKLLASIARPEDRTLATAYYEDHRDPNSCCVCLIVQREPGGGGESFVDHRWLDELGKTAEMLLMKSIDLRLSAGRGALTLELRFPVFHEKRDLQQARSAILLVEDDAYVRVVTREVLELEGRKVIEADTAEEGLRIFLKNRRSIGLVMSDVTLPGRSGMELARCVHASAPAVPVLLVSGFISDLREDSLRKTYFLEKPYDSGALLGAVARCLRSAVLLDANPAYTLTTVSE